MREDARSHARRRDESQRGCGEELERRKRTSRRHRTHKNRFDSALEWAGRRRFTEALELRWRYDDKPDISFTDLTSMAVMQELGITDVLTGDAHFEHIGLGLHRGP